MSKSPTVLTAPNVVPPKQFDPADLMAKIFESEAGKALMEKGNDFEAGVSQSFKHIHADLNAIKAKLGLPLCKEK